MAEEPFRQRLTAILAADVVGYSRLMSGDERATVAALDATRAVFRKQIEMNHGRLIDMAGDSVLAVFETAAGAVQAALTVQKMLADSASALPEDRRMRVRIGIHLGDVIEKTDGTIYGDGVNIAARLEGLAEPGGITVSEAVRGSVQNRVEASFEDLGNQSVKNISEPVHVYRVAAGACVKAAAPKRSATDIDLSLPGKPSIAVLPFTNMSGDPEQEYFTDGITEDIITELSRFHSLFVIARNSTFLYKGKAVDVRTVSKELGVRYVVEGSIRKASNRVRVTAQLIDALTGSHIWAEKYDRVLEDVFAVQEEVTRGIVTAVGPEIQTAEAIKARRRPANLSAYEIGVRAYAAATEAFATSDAALRDQAIQLARQAITLDSECVLALHALSFAQWQHVFLRTAADMQSAWTEGMDAAQRAILLDGSDGAGFVRRGMLLCFPGEPPGTPGGSPRYDEALSDLRHAHELNPNNALFLGALGYCEAVAADPMRAIQYLTASLRYNPRGIQRTQTKSMLSMAHFLARDYAHGVEWGISTASEAPRLLNVRTFLVMNYVGLGEIEKAKEAFATANLLSPEYVQARLNGYSVYRKPEDRKRQFVFMRIAAGLEDPSEAEALR